MHRVGRVPASQTVHEAYKWVDARGRPVSPPPDLTSAGDLLDDVDIRSRSSLNLLKGDDERKVVSILLVAMASGSGRGSSLIFQIWIVCSHPSVLSWKRVEC